MYYSIRYLGTSAATCVLLVAGSAALAADSSNKKDLEAFLCKDVMRLSGSERENALALVHGYRLGKAGTTQFQIDTLADLTERFIDHCLDHPSDKALETFEKLGK
jgi:hypothetical protein